MFIDTVAVDLELLRAERSAGHFALLGGDQVSVMRARDILPLRGYFHPHAPFLSHLPHAISLLLVVFLIPFWPALIQPQNQERAVRIGTNKASPRGDIFVDARPFHS